MKSLHTIAAKDPQHELQIVDTRSLDLLQEKIHFSQSMCNLNPDLIFKESISEVSI